jgi:nicotinamidase-related amidase
VNVQLRRPCLVIVDVQHAIDDPVWGPRNNPSAEAVMARLLAAWRDRELPVIHVRHDSTEPDSPYRPGQRGNDFKAEVAPAAGEVVVAKRTNSAFIGTDLADRLTTSGGDVVFVGAITNNSLEATVRMAGNLGFSAFVVEDGCWTVDRTDRRGRSWPAEDVHALALANMDGEYAPVVAAAVVLDALRRLPAGAP